MTHSTRRRTTAVAALTAAACALVSYPATADVTYDPDALVIQAHRGGPALGAPENSLALFRKAIDSGVVGRIETDVRQAKDGTLVIYHDAKIRKNCTPYAGKYVRGLSWVSLKKITCDGEPIPTVTQALETMRGSDVDVNLELKLDDTMSSAQKTAFAKKVAQTVVAAKLPAGQVSISSYYWRSYAKAIQQYGKGLRMTAMEFTNYTDPTDTVFNNVRRAKSYGVDAISFSVKDAHRDLIDFITGYGGMDVGLGDRSGDPDTRYALAKGLTTFTSDDPLAARGSVDALIDRVAAEPLQLKLTSTDIDNKTVLSKKALKKNQKSFPLVIGSNGGLLPASAVHRLEAIRFYVTVTGKGGGTVEIAPSGSEPGKDGVRVAIPNGTKSYGVGVGPGEVGRIRVMAQGAPATVTVTMTRYLTATY